jgi:RNA polymerase sigma factor for flagellar operon FliA
MTPAKSSGGKPKGKPKAVEAAGKPKAVRAVGKPLKSGEPAKSPKRTKAPKPARAATAVAVPDEVDELGHLWEEFKRSGSPQARERLILHYAPLVKYVASRVATGLPATVEQADLVSYGMFGLIDGLDKFEPARGNKFETYAIPRIKGAIIDELRAMDWVPRSVRFKAREIDKAYADLESMLKRAPTEKEVAERLGISVPELHDIISQVSFVSVLQLDELLSVGGDRGEQVSLMDKIGRAHV